MPGAIGPDELGMTLAHEHILVDFADAARSESAGGSGRHRGAWRDPWWAVGDVAGDRLPIRCQYRD